jgi:hypothetical protein
LPLGFLPSASACPSERRASARARTAPRTPPDRRTRQRVRRTLPCCPVARPAPPMAEPRSSHPLLLSWCSGCDGGCAGAARARPGRTLLTRVYAAQSGSSRPPGGDWEGETSAQQCCSGLAPLRPNPQAFSSWPASKHCGRRTTRQVSTSILSYRIVCSARVLCCPYAALCAALRSGPATAATRCGHTWEQAAFAAVPQQTSLLARVPTFSRTLPFSCSRGETHSSEWCCFATAGSARGKSWKSSTVHNSLIFRKRATQFSALEAAGYRTIDQQGIPDRHQTMRG